MNRAERYLWSDQGLVGLEYLKKQRGLFPHTITQARLGYIPPNPNGSRVWWRVNSLSFPGNAITIPWISDGILWGIKMRWLDGQSEYRYRQPKTVGPDLDPKVDKSSLDGSLYWADDILPGWPIMVVEGEFNCLIAWQDGRDMCCPVSLGTSGTVLNSRWYANLATAPRLQTLYDADPAGQKGAAKLAALSQRVHPIYLPEGIKDLNDFHLICRDAGELRGVTDWIESVMNNT